jgi:hypothetical protein
MTMHITHFTSSPQLQRFYLRFQGDEFWKQRAKMRTFPVEQSDWVEAFLWADGKEGAWIVTESVWRAVIDDFENGVEVNNDEHDRIAHQQKGYSADFIQGIYEAFMAGSAERSAREAQWRKQGYNVPTGGFVVVTVEEEAPQPAQKVKILTPDRAVASNHVFVQPINTVDEALVVLGLPRNPSPAAAKKAYYSLAKQYAPDTHPGDATCEANFRRVNMARDVVWRVFNIK